MVGHVCKCIGKLIREIMFDCIMRGELVPPGGENAAHTLGKCIAMMYQRDIKSDHAAFNYLRIRGVEKRLQMETLRLNILAFCFGGGLSFSISVFSK